MLDAPFGFAFAAGVVAAFNPCGFALLPAYLSYFLGTDGDDAAGGGAGGGGAAVAVARALRVAAAVSVGFAVVFGIAGIAITQLSVTVQRFTPWLSIVIGVALVPMGVAMAWGWQPKLTLPRLARSRRSGRAGNDRGLGAMAGFGASYATVSLSCTIPAFLVAVASTFEQADAASGLAAFGAYTVGMAAVLGTLTVAVALARESLVTRLRQVLPHVQKAAGVLLAVAGAYVAYYGYYDIRLEQGGDVPSGPVDAVGRWSGTVTRWVNDLGNGPVLGAGICLLLATVLLVLRRRRVHRSSSDCDRSPMSDHPHSVVALASADDVRHGPLVPLVVAEQAPLLARPYFAGGDPGPIVAALATVPELLVATAPFLGAVLGPSALATRTKEIVILRTSAQASCRYCVQAHTVVARDAGLSVVELRCLRGELDPAGVFADPADLAVIAWCDALVGTGAVATGASSQLRAAFADHEVVELTLLAATTLLLNRFCTALNLPTSAEVLTRLAAEGLG